ncbi:hypothetical protein MNEG_15773 [Monoraphidium neglectum]|uniref:Uncharacterized protein n=1 Tax=Monoraphidium neglectum TaxID=145388 RepID=A0A0D2LJP6_9CHLO|nr:hypothetical protein MNEG_15773 [Monoraphidium neglectum]KIY92189.1 hypothetical protein MNEG_15773 [Monoraphidium neglectum]|eukprot:XP_013891209.1 hypothetical protein MNEG_15773 [Monoraphidium neglectum]
MLLVTPILCAAEELHKETRCPGVALHGSKTQRAIAAAAPECEGVLSGCRPTCSAFVRRLPWQWRAAADPGVRFLRPHEAPLHDPRGAAAAAAPVLRAAACPDAAARTPGLEYQWAAGGGGSATPIAEIHKRRRLQECLEEHAAAALPEAILPPLARVGGGGPALPLFDLRLAWRQLVLALEEDFEIAPGPFRMHAVRGGLGGEEEEEEQWGQGSASQPHRRNRRAAARTGRGARPG